MEASQFADNQTSPSLVLDDNITMCYGESMNYIPTVQEYEEALGGYGTAFVIIGSLTTAVLYLLFIQQSFFTFSNTHKVYRRHIYWLTSIYPFVTMMSTVAVIVPRAHQLCSAIKVVYMSIGVGHFADLTLLMYGSENKMLYDLRDTPMQLNLLPLCCCFRCLPTPPTSRLRVSLLKWMIWQMKWTQALYYIILYILTISMQNSDGTSRVVLFPTGEQPYCPCDLPEEQHLYKKEERILLLRQQEGQQLERELTSLEVSPRASFLWLTLLNFVSFLSGVYALNIMGAMSDVKLLRFKYKAKCLALKLLIMTIKMQGFIFDILGLLGAFPCLGPMVTPVVYQNSLENFIFLVEMIIFGSFSYFMYRLPELREWEEPVISATSSLEHQDGATPSGNVSKEPTAKVELGSDEGTMAESQG